MLQLDPDGVGLTQLHVGDHRHRARGVAQRAESLDQSIDDVGTLRLLTDHRGICRGQSQVVVDLDHGAERKELAVLLEQLLRERQGRRQEGVEIVLRLRRCRVTPGTHRWIVPGALPPRDRFSARRRRNS